MTPVRRRQPPRKPNPATQGMRELVLLSMARELAETTEKRRAYDHAAWLVASRSGLEALYSKLGFAEVKR